MPDAAPEPLTFEQALLELEKIVRELEDGQTGLEEALLRYERGVELLRGCYEKLRQAEQRIEELVGLNEAGQAMVRPFEHVAKIAKVKKDQAGN